MLYLLEIYARRKLLESHQIIAGFSDIKSEFRTRTRTDKNLDEIRLWFSLQNGVLYTHDYNDHNCCIIIAIKTNEGWKVRLDAKTFGYQLISKVIGENTEIDIVGSLEKLHTYHGSYR